jgi:hypothetical protein
MSGLWFDHGRGQVIDPADARLDGDTTRGESS